MDKFSMLLHMFSLWCVSIRALRLSAPHAAVANPNPLKIAHVVPVVPWRSLEHDLVFKTMVAAKIQAERERPSLSVSLHATTVAGDPIMEMPALFKTTAQLTRSTKNEFKCSRTLPFARDVMKAVKNAAPDADLYVLTNADICVMPSFYTNVQDAHAGGQQGLDILKVLVPKELNGQPLAQNISQAIHEAQTRPQSHPGHDCFTWAANATEDVIRHTGNVFFGYVPVGSVIAHAIQHSVQKFQVVRGQHWTFHVGLAEREHRKEGKTAAKDCNYQNLQGKGTIPSNFAVGATDGDNLPEGPDMTWFGEP